MPAELSIREVYLAASAGENGLPDVIVLNGDALNALLVSTDYDSDRAYVVRADGIEPLLNDWGV